MTGRKEFAWTEERLRTLRMALDLAFVERDSYLDALQGTDPAVEKRTRGQMSRIRALRRALFGADVQLLVDRKAEAGMATVSILDLMAGRAG